MSVDLRKLFVEGQDKLNIESAAVEATKKDRLRVGNSGYMVGDKVFGRDPRNAVMRYFGVEEKFPLKTRIMFHAGELAENIFIDRFKQSWPGNVHTQSEIPVEWLCKGTLVTGSPDIVLTDKTDTPVFGIECKMICSYWTMHSVTPWKESVAPKPDHLAQAAHYAYKMGQQIGEDYVEWAVAYVCPNNYHVHTPAVKNSDQYREEFTRKKGLIFRIDPHVVFYYISIDADGRVLFRREGTDKIVPTQMTVQGIERYYEMLVDCIEQRKLPPRVVNADVFGKVNKGWTVYDKQYNDFSELHDLYDQGKIGFDEFLDMARNV